MANILEEYPVSYNTTYPKSSDVTDNPPNSSGSHLTTTHYGSVDIGPGESTLMKNEKNRLESFGHNSWKSLMDPRKLAKSGFYYYGVSDYVRCAFCKVEIGKWQPGDDCQIDHQRWSYQCPFIRGFNVGNIPLNPNDLSQNLIPISQDVCGRYGIEIRPNSVQEQLYENMTENTNGHNEELTINSIDINPHSGPSYRRYCTEQARLASFKEWPTHLKQKPQDLAEAGFFYMGKQDKTICFHCGGGLDNWEEDDDPWEQHARWFSKCTYVLINKGDEYVRAICNKHPPRLTVSQASQLISTRTETSEDTPPTPTVVPNQVANTSNNQKSETELKSAEQNINNKTNIETTNHSERTSSSSSSQDDKCVCGICLTEPWNILFLPCKHAFTCQKCAPNVSTCPLCNTPIAGTLKIFPAHH